MAVAKSGGRCARFGKAKGGDFMGGGDEKTPAEICRWGGGPTKKKFQNAAGGGIESVLRGGEDWGLFKVGVSRAVRRDGLWNK